ncbi:uncharacterized protein LOC116294654 [Actinia tenebrosa]|uniref:Uncharacterized protein LOC116294654 n=1 Tax=Actinia tenebrosa TaxID=6105 RepID=A0A6P8HZW6_ACTTE|nr:uncharacterized protein LOC116294654 [Actinia tenebrosa]
MKCNGLVVVLASAVFGFLSTTAQVADLPKEINFFTEAGLTTNTPPGVSKVSGHHSNSPAYRFTSSTRNIISRQKGLDDARRVISESHDFVVSAYVKMDSKAKYGKNAILSISSSDGQQLYFFIAISSDWQTSQMKIEFSFVDGGNLNTIAAKTPYSVDVTVWHKLSLRVQDTEKLLRFYLDDKMLDVHKFDHTLSSIPSNSQMRLAQAFEIMMEGTGQITNRFIGDLQDVKISLGSSSDKCNTPTTVPAPCACPSKGGSGCFMDGRSYSNGQQWNKDKCNVCQCKDNNVICIHTCPVCRDSGKIYFHGDKWHPSNDSCMDCKCESGKTVCSPPTCAKPDCRKPGYSGQTIVLPGQCCPICKEDQCKARNLVYKTCSCNKTCANHHSKAPCGGKCSEGCFCPDDQVLADNGKCISPVDCKCRSNGKTFKPGQFHSPSPCKFCICLLGYLHCSNMCF